MKKHGEIGDYVKIGIIILIVVVIVISGTWLFKKNNAVNNTVTAPFAHQNPINSIMLANTKNGNINETAVVEQGIKNFNETYINYLIIALGTSYLHKSAVGYGNPNIEMILNQETWNTELGDVFITKKGNSDSPDLRIKMKKEDAVKALMSNDIKQFMKDAAKNGKIQIEMIAGKIELYSKGYLDMYNALTGEDKK